MKGTKVGIIAAMNEEIGLIQTRMDGTQLTEIAGIPFLSGYLGGTEVVATRGGVCKVNAAVSTQILIEHYSVKNVILVGVAGAVAPELKVGDIVISKDAVHHDVDARAVKLGFKLGEIPFSGRISWEADPYMIKMAQVACETAVVKFRQQCLEKPDMASLGEYGFNSVIGRILTGEQFIASSRKIARLRQLFEGHCVEMEGAAVAQTCVLNRKPFIIIRVISDQPGRKAWKSYQAFTSSVMPELLFQVVIEMLKRL